MARGIQGKEPDARVVYGDIIDHPRHVSRSHPPMSLYDRAAQFAPFAALSGYDDLVQEEARLTEKRRELTEEEKERLGRKLSYLSRILEGGRHPVLTFTFFVPDEKKEGGRYERVTGRVLRMDLTRRKILYSPGESLSPLTLDLDALVQLTGKELEEVED